MKRTKKGHYIENGLNENLNAFFKYEVEGDNTHDKDEIIRGVGHKNDRNKHKSLVKKKEGDELGSLELDMSDLRDDFDLLLKFEKMPSKNSIKGFKFFPGSDLGTVHHIESQEKGKKLIVVIHCENRVPTPPNKDHVDPKIEHPETSLDFDW
ncbi:hypothetical protein [Rhodohalobacter sp. 8-1]|uniref:hypothetical protein n=1 Tax=Rhodohalobacter sp. 8-1 TaxID=3131972 RepID=UPI0030EDFA88